jgi:RNAse (barnase) inhibitor barstar
VSTRRKLEPNDSGVYAMPADSADLRKLARAGEVAWKEVDLAAVRNKEELMRAFSKALDLPQHFGENWDALEDILGDSECLPHAGYVIRLRKAARAQQTLKGDWDTLLDILRDTSTYWIGRGKPFVVLVDGAVGLPAWT